MQAPTGCCGVQTFPNTLQSDGLHFPCSTSPQRQAGFGFVFILCAVAGKFIGASVGAKVTGNGWKDSLCCGASMCVRAEVCLVSAQKGIVSLRIKWDFRFNMVYD